MNNPLDDDSRWTVRGNCGVHYLGRDRDLRGADCTLHAGHDGPHESPQRRHWLA